MKLRLLRKLARRGDARARKLLDRRCARFIEREAGKRLRAMKPIRYAVSVRLPARIDYIFLETEVV